MQREKNITMAGMERKWRCDNCGTLLGVQCGDKFHIKYKRAQYIVQGKVIAICFHCSRFNELADFGTEKVMERI